MSHGIPRVSETEPRLEKAREKELQKIEEYKYLIDAVETKIRERQYTIEVLSLTSKLLTRNPEYYTAWNHRRRILQHQFHEAKQHSVSPSNEEYGEEDAPQSDKEPPHSGVIQNLITEDLQFLVPLLIKFPKCYWMWNHRLWLLKQASTLLPASIARAFWEGELGLVRKMLARDSRNFHGWGYRRTIVAALESKRLNPNSEEANSSMAKEEFDYTTKMIMTNMSNFSAWHNRSKLILRLLEESNADDTERRKMLDEEILWITEALYTAPYDQSLWFYHQNLMCTFDPQIAPNTMAPNLAKKERLEYITKEIDNVVELREGAEDCKWIYQSLIQLCMTYKASCNEWPPQADHLGEWTEELQKLDPLRKGRWVEVKRALQL